MPVTKLSVNVPDEAIEILKDIAARRHTTMTEVVRDAIAMEKFLDDETRKGNKVLIEDRDHRVRELVLRPRIEGSER
ncbi:MAG TPA: ribbon-helix-helix protein, CopG family [Thermomicrobiaceae bacterium]|nr:ribbon-helix-helix protein, CopG family [Thermomicrobiaceae bacterium]